MSASESAKPHNEHAVATALGLRLENGSPVLDSKSLLKSVGGAVGIVESSLPSLLFISFWLATKSATVAIAAAVTPVVVATIWRLIRKQPLTQVASGVLIAGLSAWMALRPGGSTSEYFLPGLLTNLGYFVVLAGSVVIRWPLVGVLLGLILRHNNGWRKVKSERSPYTAATLTLAAIFAIRLLVEVPLFLTNSFELLAITKLVLGLPLYAFGLWTAWLLVRKAVHKPHN